MIFSGIQVRKNEFGISDRLFKRLQTFGDKYPSLAPEPLQVIKGLRVKSVDPTPTIVKMPKITERFVESKERRLPPNLYNFKDHAQEISEKQMGKLGPLKCFTVARDDSTVMGHHAMAFQKETDPELDFYNLPSEMNRLNQPCNAHKLKFLKDERFHKPFFSSPSPTTYYPQNYLIKPKLAKSDNPVMPTSFYPSTTVPVLEMSYLKNLSSAPPPNRYEKDASACLCPKKKGSFGVGYKKCLCTKKILGNGHQYVFNSKIFRLVKPTKITQLDRIRNMEHPMDNLYTVSRIIVPTRDEISFRRKMSISLDHFNIPKEEFKAKEIRYNTLTFKRNKFSFKSGRPIAFGSSFRRFPKTDSEFSVKIGIQTKSCEAKEEEKKPKSKGLTAERLIELSTPKDPLPIKYSRKIKVFATLPAAPPLSNYLNKNKGLHDSVSGISDINLRSIKDPITQVEENTLRKFSLEADDTSLLESLHE
ncbi:unnamed protein product [Diamesa tonsa]